MKRIVVLLTTLLVSVCMAGCGLIPSLDLTESEQSVIAEYAAGLLLKYDRNYSGSLMEVEEDTDDVSIIPEVPMESVQVEVPDEPDEQGEFIDPDFSEDLFAEDSGEASDEPMYSDIPMSEAIGVNGFTIMYKNFEVHDIYPEQESSDIVFSLQAMNGNKLVVMNFAVTNDGGDKNLCDVLNTDVSFKVVVNGDKQVNASKTILLNDLSSYYEEIEGYGMSEAVVVCEMPEEEADNIQDLALVIKKDGQSYNYRLR